MKISRTVLSRYLFANDAKNSRIERWVFAIGLACCLLGLVGLLRWGPSDPVKEIRVDAEFSGLTASELWPYLQEVFGEDLLAVDMPAMAARLQQHPWVESVQMKRLWPDSLLINITEPVAFAYWQGLRGETGFVTSSGEALEAAASPDINLVYLGEAGQAKEFMTWQQELSVALKGSEWQLQKLACSEYGQWRVYITSAEVDALELRFGESWDLALWQRFTQAWAAGLQQRRADIEYVDLRYRGGMALGWRNHVSQQQNPNFDLSMWAQAPQGV